MKNIEIPELLQFIDNAVTQERKKEIEKFLLENIDHGKIFMALSALYKKLGSKEAVEAFLDGKSKSLLKNAKDIIENQ